MAPEIDATSRRTLTRAFQTEDAVLAGKSMAEVHAFLTEQIARVLDRNPAQLMSILYRIDVREHNVKTAIATAPAGELAARLATLIINRQLEKLKYRAR